jgi:hypothetical protein
MRLEGLDKLKTKISDLIGNRIRDILAEIFFPSSVAGSKN